MLATQDIRAIEHVFSIWDSDALGARECGVAYDRFAKWKQRGRIPPESFPAVIQAARRRRIYLNDGLLNRLNRPRGTVKPAKARE